MTRSRLTCSVAAAALLVALPQSATAYCRLSIEDYSIEDYSEPYHCGGDLTLSWLEHCLPIGVHFDSFERGGMARKDVKRALELAMAAWSEADCGDGQHPSFAFNDRGEMHCDVLEYVRRADRTNNNIVFLRSKLDLREGDRFGLTTTTFHVSSGEILDSDIEILAEAVQGGDAGADRTDLETILLHELGHFLGLGHSDDESSVMHKDVEEDLSRHTLSADDEAGVCAIFPPDVAFSCPEEEEGRDFTRECGQEVELEGCSFKNGATSGGRAAEASLGLLLLLAWRRRRARSPGYGC